MACNQCFCLACVRTNTVALVERCGKFQAIKGPGCQCLVWPVDSIVGRVSLRVRQLDVNCETKTKDNVFVNVVISVQYQVVLEKAFDAFYKLANPEIQIQPTSSTSCGRSCRRWSSTSPSRTRSSWPTR